MITRRIFLFLLGFLIASLSFVLASGCGSTAGQGTSSSQQSEETHWSYSGNEGPQNWGALDSAFAACSQGQSQSPIDLTNAVPKNLPNIVFHYQPSRLVIVNNGHTVQVDYDPGSYIEVDGKRYDLVQYHYHVPSEHSIDGKLLPAELHLVHQSSDGQYAVIAVFLEAGVVNAGYETFINNLPPQKGPQQEVSAITNAADLLPMDMKTYHYTGSLTTPPCTEGVAWYIMTTPVQISTEQLMALEKVYDGNNRPVQPLNGRSLIEDITP